MEEQVNQDFELDEIFTIGIRKKGTDDEYRFIDVCYDRWVADPLIAEENGETYLFYEAAHKTHGQIEVVKINDDCSVSEPTVILSDTNHFSYPFVFKYKGVWYMIPETNELDKVNLYKATSFPYKWELDTTLLNAKAVDSTIFDCNNRKYMVTYLINQVDECVTPKAYEIDMDNKCLVRELGWVNPVGVEVRGAGAYFEKDGKLYRPAQLNKIHSYGDGVIFYEVVRCDDVYEEKRVYTCEIPKQKVGTQEVTGMHTYTTSSKFEIIDVRINNIG